MRAAFAMAATVSAVYGQQRGNLQAEVHPPLTTFNCEADGHCRADRETSVVLDANWRWTHQVGQPRNCYTGNEWDRSLCPDPQTCAQNCALEGVDYSGTYGINSNDDELSFRLVTHGPYSTNIGGRTYVMDTDRTYKKYMLKNKEFVIDVDVSEMPCGINGALYFAQMDADGGSSKYPGNRAGAEYGTGYCDAQCPQDIKFINGEANMEDWTPSPSDPNSGTGKYGTCCTEMDIWEANSISSAVTPHICKTDGQYRCTGPACGDGANRYNGVCDRNGCDMNPWRGGNHTFYGPGSQFAVDTTRKFSVVTQFVTHNKTAEGDLVAINRFFVQDGKKFPHPAATNLPKAGMSHISDDFCNVKTETYQENNNFEKFGGLKKFGDELAKGMVLILSQWVDFTAHMLWLDSTYPANSTLPGASRGSCPTSSGVPQDVINQHPDSTVKFSKISLGPIGFTDAALRK